MRQNNFDRIAFYYDFLANLVFGDAIRAAQRALLVHIPPKAKVLIVGGGTGWILTELLALRPEVQVTYREASSQMIRLTKNRFPEGTPYNVVFELARQGAEPDQKRYDVVFTGFFLDMFQPDSLDEQMEVLWRSLRASGVWLCADFELGHAAPKWQIVLLASMLLFFRIVSNLEADSLPFLPTHFERLGLICKKQVRFFGGMIVSRVWTKPE